MAFDRNLLSYFASDALRPYSDDFEIIENSNPFRFRMNGHKYAVHVSYVHDSGNNRDNPDEVRIQLSRNLIEQQRVRFEQGERVAFIGFYERGDTFLAWDPRHIFSLTARTVVSVYGRQSQSSTALRLGYATHSFRSMALSEDSFSIALPSYSLGFYLENYEKFHRLSGDREIERIISASDDFSSASPSATSEEVEVKIEDIRETFTSTRVAYKRNGAFVRAVLSAYDSRCCICDKQLKIVQAAHIVPHALDHSNDEVTNGLALCVEHHKLYDDALLLPGPGQKLIFNDRRAAFLQEAGLDSGLDEVAARAKSDYRIPDDPDLQPNPRYLEDGLRIRLA